MTIPAPLPLYYRLETVLRQKIEGQEIPPGTRLPTEVELMAEYRVSRITVRQALAALARDGLILRRRGVGTVVAARPRHGSLKLTGFIEDLIAMGVKTHARVLDFRLVPAGERVAQALRVPPGEPVWLLRRVRLADRRPFSHIVAYLPREIGVRLRRRELASTPLLTLLEGRLGLRLGGAEQVIEATLADGQLAALLEVPVGAPLLAIERTVSAADGRPVEYVQVHYRADRYKYSVQLKRGRPGSGSWSYH